MGVQKKKNKSRVQNTFFRGSHAVQTTVNSYSKSSIMKTTVCSSKSNLGICTYHKHVPEEHYQKDPLV